MKLQIIPRWWGWRRIRRVWTD